ncbi:MAG: hypothetical protein JXQ27_04040 [Acidobacteria bacterium]|nr:hypothetical protein [Acidobacteriota bacterium]
MNRAVFAVLDCRRIGGHSVYPVPPVFPGKTVAPATEKAYLVIPPDPLKRLTGFRPALNRIDLCDDYLQLHMDVSVEPCTSKRIYFFLGDELDLRSVSAADDYIRLCRCARESGRVDYIYDPADIKTMGDQILYWDGLEWTASPNLNRYWTDARR